MKKQVTYLLFALLLLNIKPSLATTYYISNSGNDANSGTSAALAWQSIAKLNITTLQPGDSVLFETGGIFRGQINLLNSGAAGQSIYFGSYGSIGANPIISGCKTVTHWSVYSGNIYVANIGDAVSNVFENKVMMTSARYPNKGFLTIDSSGVNTGLYDEHLLIQSDWSGAHLKVRTSDFKYEDVPIASSNGGWITLAIPTVNTLTTGYGYYLDNYFNNLDTAGEWFYDTSSQSLFIYTASSADTLNVEATVFNYGINGNSNSFIKINGLDFENQRKDGALFTGTNQNVSFTNCNFRNCYLRAIALNVSSNDTIDHCTFNNIMGDCLALNSLSNSIVSNNQLNHIGTIPGYGLDGTTQYTAISFNGNGNSILNNVMDTIGSSAVVFSGKNDLIDKNYIQNVVCTLDSENAITSSNNDSSQCTISNNFIFNAIGNNQNTPKNSISANAILLNSSSYFSLLHNTISNTSAYGISILNSIGSNLVENNVVYDSHLSQIYFSNSNSTNVSFNNSTTGNIFYSLSEFQYPILINGDSAFHPGKFDFNYYCNPYDFYAVYQNIHEIIYNTIPYFLNNWKTEYGDDANSKGSLVKFRSYIVTDTSSNDLIENGTFTNNFDGWTTQPTTNNNLLLDNDNGLDGGCVKVEIVADTPVSWTQLHSSALNYETNSIYQFSFSGKAAKRINTFIDIKDIGFPFADLGYTRFFPLDTPRSDFEDVFKSTQSNSNATLTFEIRYPDSVDWLDNIHLYQVQAIHNDSTKLSRLIYNYSPNTINVSLGDSLYHDLDGKSVFGHYQLNPYSSYILTLDSPLFTSVKETLAKNTLEVFPNPINPSFELLYYKLNGIDENSKVTLQLIDIYGRTVFEKISVNNSGKLEIPSGISAGLYLFKAVNEKQSFEKKIIITK